LPAPVTGGTLIGFPYQGTHTDFGNWQSDNAIDIKIPKGTPVYATHDGTIGPNIGPFASTNPQLQGQRLTVLWTGNAAYYAHLSKIVVRPGQQVKAGQLLGYSGVANGVAHLHFAVEKGSPLDWVKNLPRKIKGVVTGENPPATSAASATGAGCAGTQILFVISIFGCLEIVKIFH